VRALFSGYSGPLYRVARANDSATLDIPLLSPGGYVNASAQDVFCPPSPAPSGLPAIGATVQLSPAALPGLSFRHCDAQGFVTPDDGSGPAEDHLFLVVPALSGAPPGALSFQSVNFPTFYIAPVSGAEPGRLGVVEKPAPDAASWVATPAPSGGFTLALPSMGGAAMTVGSNITGSCASSYGPPSASVYLGAGTAFVARGGGAVVCTIDTIYDQSAQGNHLKPGPGGGAAPRPDKPVSATDFPITIGGGHRAYGAHFRGGQGYRRDNTTGVAMGDGEESIYMVVRGDVFNDGCCMDYGNAEKNDHDDGAGTMECVYFGTWDAAGSGWCGGEGKGPWIMADL